MLKNFLPTAETQHFSPNTTQEEINQIPLNLAKSLEKESRMKEKERTRKEIFKSKGAKTDAAAELAAEAKQKREEHLERIRKLELVKEKRSPKKSESKIESP